MPTYLHESLVKLLTESPRLLPWLLRECAGLPIPPDVRPLPAPETVRQVQYPEYTADGTVLISDPKTGQREAFIVEVQLKPKSDKVYVWPLYVAGVRHRLRCKVTLVVVTPKESTARWANRPIVFGSGGGGVRPVVLGPSDLPAVPSSQAMDHTPALGALSVIVHGERGDAYQLATRALAAAAKLGTTDGIRAKLYADLILGFLPDAASQRLLDEMEQASDTYISDFARHYVQEGRELGHCAGLIDALGMVLRSRGLRPNDEQQARISSCADSAQLAAWMNSASSVPSVEALLQIKPDP